MAILYIYEVYSLHKADNIATNSITRTKKIQQVREGKKNKI